MRSDSVSKSAPWLAPVGALLVLPAILVPAAGALGLDPSSPFLHPVVVLGGLLVALLLNAMAVFRLRFQQDDAGFLGSVRVLARWPNLAVVVITAVLALGLLGYGFLENFRVVSR
jgi:hypothetical protein